MVATRPPMHLSGRCVCPSDPQFVEEKGIRAEDLVIGALESAFQECVSVAFGWGRDQGLERHPCPQRWSPWIFAWGGQDGVGLLVTVIVVIISPPVYPVPGTPQELFRATYLARPARPWCGACFPFLSSG